MWPRSRHPDGGYRSHHDAHSWHGRGSRHPFRRSQRISIGGSPGRTLRGNRVERVPGQSPETQATIARILGANEFCSVGSVRVIGHTDTSGSAAYNLGLSQRRAKDARDELVSQGVNSAIITSEGKGETEPFIPTGDGVKEQLNRRTEVLITLTELGVIN